MPDEVFDQWITPQILANGWPFVGLDEPMTRPGWAEYFRNQKLEFWANVNWKLTSSKRIDLKFPPTTNNNTSEIIEYCRVFFKTKVMPKTRVPYSIERSSACANFIRAHGKLPKPLVCFVQSDKLILLDGQHRIAAMDAFNVHDEFSVDIWIGESDA